MTDKPQNVLDCIQPDWTAPPHVSALSTTRAGGHSDGVYTALNLGRNSGDEPGVVERNRQLLEAAGDMPAQPIWLNQVHGTRCLHADERVDDVTADAAYSARRGTVLAILTADCLPVLFCNTAGTEIAAAHAGWRGLQSGVLEATLARFSCAPADVIAWLGPCISAASYEIGSEVFDAFTRVCAADEQYFSNNRPGHWLADLHGLARARLNRAGVALVTGGQWCTARDAERFFSYRRDGATGRMASCIWMI